MGQYFKLLVLIGLVSSITNLCSGTAGRTTSRLPITGTRVASKLGGTKHPDIPTILCVFGSLSYSLTG